MGYSVGYQSVHSRIEQKNFERAFCRRVASFYRIHILHYSLEHTYLQKRKPPVTFVTGGDSSITVPLRFRAERHLCYSVTGISRSAISCGLLSGAFHNGFCKDTYSRWCPLSVAVSEVTSPDNCFFFYDIQYYIYHLKILGHI